MPFEYAAANEAAETQHLLERLRIDAAQAKVRLEVLGALARAGCRSLVKSERQGKFLEQVPERFVIRIIPVLTVHDIRTEKHRAKTIFLSDSARFAQSVVDVIDRNHPGAEQAVRVGLTKIVQPIVISACHRGGEAQILIGESKDAEATRRKQD